jgi:hypothetical protein
MLWKLALFPFSGKKVPNLVEPYTELFSITGHNRNSNLLRYVPENRTSSTTVTGK